MTTDHTHIPDDHVAAGRARALSLQRDAEEALGRLTQELAAIRLELGHRVMPEAYLAVVEQAGGYQRKYEAILGPEITACRADQDIEWGGPSHDDTHKHFEWIAFIRKFVDRAEHYGYHADSLPAEYNTFDLPADPERYEAYLIHVAALAIAAIQSSRRKRAPKEPTA